MASTLFSGINELKRGLDAAWVRDGVIRNNIANGDTPNFKRSAVEFESLYKKAIEEESDFHLKKTRDGHMDLGDPSPVQAKVVLDESTSMRMDGNNVDPDKEMVDLATNVIYYSMLQTKVNSEFNQLKMAIKEGR